jgi:signal peptidase I
MPRRLSPQRLLIGGLIVALVLATARILALQGWIRPVRVVSGSMVERLLGEHYSVTCADCGIVFQFGVESMPADEQAVCPNCGLARNPVRLATRRRGDRVIVDRGAFLFQRPRRFDLVALRDPRQPVRRIVKRVLGLPGEQIAIRHGDLYINGTILRKSLAEFQRLALFVHDNSHSPHPEQFLLPRWRPAATPSGWQADGTTIRFVPATAVSTGSADSEQPKSQADWLSYHHWRCYANPYPRSMEAPVADNYGYNQGESRELREVVDLMLRLRAGLPGNGELALRIHDGREWWSARIDLAQRHVTLRQGERQLAVVPVPSDVLEQQVQTQEQNPSQVENLPLDFGLLDRQLILGIAGREVVRQGYEPGLSPFQPIPAPVSIGGLRNEIQVSELRLQRDIHYLDPWSVGKPWQAATAAGANEYVLLGDNPPISDDSRRWDDPFVTLGSILGRVLPYDR